MESDDLTGVFRPDVDVFAIRRARRKGVSGTSGQATVFNSMRNYLAAALYVDIVPTGVRSALTVWAKPSRTPRLNQPFNRAAAALGRADFILTVVNCEFVLEITELAIGLRIVA